MNLSKLFKMQKVLDEKIIREKNLGDMDRLPYLILALQVELGECANEWRGFKYWSNKQTPNVVWKGGCKRCDYWETRINDRKGQLPDGSDCDCLHGLMPTNPVLEEYVDCLHFILSIGLETKTTVTSYFHSLFGKFVKAESMWDSSSIISEFRDIFDLTSRVGTSYSTLVLAFLDLGYMLGFTWEQIEKAYQEKNAVNHDRQVTGY